MVPAASITETWVLEMDVGRARARLLARRSCRCALQPPTRYIGVLAYLTQCAPCAVVGRAFFYLSVYYPRPYLSTELSIYLSIYPRS